MIEHIELSTGLTYEPVYYWGSQAWEVWRPGLWFPMLADGADVFALAEYCEGDVTKETFTDRAARDAAMDLFAWKFWTLENCLPEGLAPFPDDRAERRADNMPSWARGPFNDDRWNELPGPEVGGR